MHANDGYVSEIEYTHGYCREMAPAHLRLACLARGIALPARERPLRYLELAFGQGLSLNIHAAACPGEYWGFDFNANHARNAQAIASACGSGARIFADSFEEFAARADVPEFDIITLHGTWSWIAPSNRHLVIEIVRRKLAPGGLFYVSYNCLPGWAGEIPLRHLLVEHATLAATATPALVDRIDASLAFAQSLIDADAGYFRAQPGAARWLAKMHKESRHYLAHEYFNRDWHPMPFSEVANALSAAELAFVASANLTDNAEGSGLSNEARAVLDSVEHPLLRETVFDFVVNQRFRSDIFARAPQRLSPAASETGLQQMPFILIQHPDYVPRKVALAGGTIDLTEMIYRPLLQAFAENDFAPKTLLQLAQHVACRDLPLQRLTDAALMLTGIGSLHPVQSSKDIEAAAPGCAALNAHLLERAIQGNAIAALASPVIGAGVYIAGEEALFLHAITRGQESPDAMANHACNCHAALDRMQGITANETPGMEEQAERIQSNARAFAKIRLPILRALRIV